MANEQSLTIRLPSECFQYLNVLSQKTNRSIEVETAEIVKKHVYRNFKDASPSAKRNGAPSGPRKRYRVLLRWSNDECEKTKVGNQAEASADAIYRIFRRLSQQGKDIESVLLRDGPFRKGAKSVLSKLPDTDFVNPKGDNPSVFQHHEIGSTGIFLNTHHDLNEKAKVLRHIVVALGLPEEMCEFVEAEQ